MKLKKEGASPWRRPRLAILDGAEENAGSVAVDDNREVGHDAVPTNGN